MSLKRGVNGNIKSLLILIKRLGLRQQQTFKIRIVGERERDLTCKYPELGCHNEHLEGLEEEFPGQLPAMCNN